MLSVLASLVISGPAKPISSDLFGIFFEDINYSADGGLYAELVQNRSFEYAPIIRNWNALTAWTFVKEAGGEGRVNIRSEYGIHPQNPHFAAVFVEKGQAGLRNEGFDGIVVRKGETYDASLFTLALSGKPGPVTLRLEGKDGTVLATATVAAPTDAKWKKQSTTLVPNADSTDARLTVLCSGSGSTGLDMVSLFPRKTFKGHSNGLRPDLAQAIADLKPRFIRFPGGCIVHGGWLGLSAFYDWKKTVGPVETRATIPNAWNYFQTTGIGYFEYFQFCEDIGAKPLPVVPAAVTCQNNDYNWGKGQEALPLSEMKAYIQDVLDLIEYANGPATSKWGKVRAAAGHPKPFNLEYLGIGNEEAITPLFESRFKMIYDVVHKKYPKLKLVGTVGPSPSGEDFEAGWKIARKEKLQVVDEHYYMEPNWFWDNLRRYDSYNRNEAKVYAGEYAAHDKDRANTLRSALAEAAHLTTLERNGDVVQLASYAPLLAKEGRTQWRPDLIYFDNTTVYPSVNYYVQQLFMTNAGDRAYPVDLGSTKDIAGSVVQDSKTGDVMIKLVSRRAEPTTIPLDLSGIPGLSKVAKRSVLTGDPLAENLYGRPATVLPKVDTLTIGSEITIPAHSLTVLRLQTK